MAQHFGLPLSSEKAVEIADRLFGRSSTFRNGQIGAWKEQFSAEHINLFKQQLGKELIELGYETSNDW